MWSAFSLSARAELRYCLVTSIHFRRKVAAIHKLPPDDGRFISAASGGYGSPSAVVEIKSGLYN
jgi:hypothetical protein